MEEGDKLACRFVVRATHRGPLQGIPPSGRSVTLPGITILRFRDGRCVERWSQADFAGMLRQIGVLAAAAG
jgi:predicted ester cyclase